MLRRRGSERVGLGWAVIGFGLAWGLQAALSIRQAHHIRQTINALRYDGRPGYLGLGVVRNRWGRGAYALVLTDRTGRVTSVHLLNGVTVFARFHPDHRWEGRTVEDLEIAASPSTPNGTSRTRLSVEERAMVMAVHQVALQMQTAQTDGSAIEMGR